MTAPQLEPVLLGGGPGIEHLPGMCCMDTLKQIAARDTWDGNLIGKGCRDNLLELGLVIQRDDGWNRVTDAGLTYLLEVHENAK